MKHPLVQPGEQAAIAHIQVSVKKSAKTLIPCGQRQVIRNNKGYLVRDNIPFFYIHWHTWNRFHKNPFAQYIARILSHYTLMNAAQINGAEAAHAKPGRIPLNVLNNATAAYKLGFLAIPRSESYIFILPDSVIKRHPEELARNHRGEAFSKPYLYTNVPRLGSPWLKKRIRETHLSMALWCRAHPAIMGPLVYEEMHYNFGGYSPLEVEEYRKFLRTKYATIAALNHEWKSAYRTFSEISPPTAESENQDMPLYGTRSGADPFILAATEEKIELSPNALSFSLFKIAILLERQEWMYRTIKDIDPDMPVLGYKTARGPLMWYSNQWADVSGYCDITSSLAMPGISTFEAVPQPSIVSLCEYWEWPSGGWPHYPFYRGPWQRNNSWTEDLYSVQKAAYARIVKEIFDGSKSIFMEDYSATAPHGGCEYHYFHRKKHYRELDQQKKCIGWNDQPVVYTPDENKEPDVSIERKTLELARAYQLCYRLAPLFLPAKKPKAETGILATYETRFTPGGKWAFLEAVPALVDLLDRIHAPCEVVTGYQRDEINRFKVLFVTFAATLLDADLANRLKIFVRKGGTLVFIQGAGRYDLNTAREGNREPLFGLDTFLCARADRSIVPNFEKPILLKDGSTLPTYEWPPQFSVGQIPWIGSLPPHRFESTGVLSLLPGGSVIGAMDGHPAIISANKGRTISMICPQLQIIDRLAAPFDATWRAFFNAILVRAGVKKPVEISSSANTHLLDPAILEGNGYWLAAVVNYGSQKQHCRVRFSFLPKGTYDITDVTGEKPIIVKDKKGQKRLKIDRNGRKTRFVAESANAFVLKSQGLSLAIGPRKAMVLLVRKAGEPVLVNAPVFSIQALCNKPAYVVIDKTTSKQCHKAIEKLECVFRNRKIPARFMAPEDIKMRKTSFTVELDGVRLELFRNQPLKTNRNLIIIGTTRNNPLAAHIEKPEVFTYDKVLEKVTRLYPGKGRGIIQLVESINSPAYDSTGKCRHALLVQGSDTAGTMRAIETLTRLLT